MIKKIKTIGNFGIFSGFDWDMEVFDNGKVLDFKEINIFYGRNYSGKTTLSRILRGMETGQLSDKIENPSFEVMWDDNITVSTQGNLKGHKKEIRVFNTDFVRDNLHFIANPEDGIEPFAILGDGNNKIESEITVLEKELGKDEEGNETGLYADYRQARDNCLNANIQWNDKKHELDSALKKKALDRNTGIKYNPGRFGDQNYNIEKLRQEIERVRSSSYQILTEEECQLNEKTIEEKPLSPILLPAVPKLQLGSLIEEARPLIIQTISESGKIEELVKNAILNRWVKEGRELHKGQYGICAFCGNPISKDRWRELEMHFDEEADRLETKIEKLLETINLEERQISNILEIDENKFYSLYRQRLSRLKKDIILFVDEYKKALSLLKKQLEARKEDILNAKNFEPPTDVSGNLLSAYSQYRDLCNESNKHSEVLSEEQKRAQERLRLHEVYKFQKDIWYELKIKNINKCEKAVNAAEGEKKVLERKIEGKKEEIRLKRKELNDEEKGAKKVNEYLNNFFGHRFLCLSAQKNEMAIAQQKHVRFEVIREGKRAYHLSEGECSLLAFCYFLAKLDDTNTHNVKPIIWIDDPISSLDGNHIFFVYSLIRGEIIDKKRYEQIFISTHSLDFLKYLKRLLPDNKREKKSSWFMIVRNLSRSTIRVMPSYMKEYVTEFNYLFEQIYRCSRITEINDTNYTIFYNFGNNARKFLEIYLYYKYPDNGGHMAKLAQFFGEENIPAVLVDRINNEYSHMAGVFERGASPMEVPEMNKAAQQILEALQKDAEQYTALLRSIGESTSEPNTLS